MSKFVAALCAVFTLGLAFFVDIGSGEFYIHLQTNALVEGYVALNIFYNLLIILLWLFLAWLVLVKSRRSIALSLFLIALAIGFAFAWPLTIFSIYFFDHAIRLFGSTIFHGIIFPLQAGGPRSYLSLSGTFFLVLGVVNLFRPSYD